AVAAVGDFGHRARLPSASFPSYPVNLTKRLWPRARLSDDVRGRADEDCSTRAGAILSSTLAHYVHDLRTDGLPAGLIAMARQHLLDTIGCCLAAKDLDTSKGLAAWLVSEGGAEQATAMGVSRLLPAPQAAFVNGLLARSLEYDDMAMPDLHPSGVIVPVVLAVGEWQETAGAELLTAIVLGLELCIRIGRAGYDAGTRTARVLQRGQGPSAILGPGAGAAPPA